MTAGTTAACATAARAADWKRKDVSYAWDWKFCTLGNANSNEDVKWDQQIYHYHLDTIHNLRILWITAYIMVKKD